jgi:ABC-type uncharacterized transport system permease subunit
MTLLGLRFERRERASGWWRFIALLLALVVSLQFSAILIILARANVGEAFAALYAGAFGSWKAFLETLVKATPLILAGLSVTVAFRGQIWNIGVEGQILAGAMAAYWISSRWASLPSVLLFIAILAAAFVAGAFCGWIPGYLKAKLGLDEVLVTVMLNYIIIYFLSYLLADPWREPGQYYHMTPEIPEAARFPTLFANSRLHFGFIIALVVALLVYWLLWKTRLGYEIRAIGLNPTAAKFKGVNTTRVIILIMIISGGLAGLAGAGELIGLHYRLKTELSTGIMASGIIIAMLAGLNPLWVIPAAILFGGLMTGASSMQILTGVPTAMVQTIQAIVLFLVLSTQVIAMYRIRRASNA